ncbi:MAG: elongation factor P [Deltaproteobacteria bacterium]|nr:elongation factor P [Deltaproteobacteria bacterium]
MITATQIRVGHILKIDQELMCVLKVHHVTPGKGNAVVQTDLRSLKTKTKTNKRFRSTETVDLADVTSRKMNFLYQDGEIYHFMDPNTFEQVEIQANVLDEAVRFLHPEMSLTVSSYEGMPVSVTLPSKISFTVAECDPPSKGIAGSQKNARLSNNMTIQVPLFIKAGDAVTIDTETGDYLEKS